MRTLSCSACTLEPLESRHAPEMFVVLADPAIYEFGGAPPQDEDGLRARYARLAARRSPDGSERWLNWVLRLADGVLAGYVQASVLPGPRALIAYELNSRYWRQGIGSAAVQAMLAELFEQYGVREVSAVLHRANHRSRGLLSRLGFVPANEAVQQRDRDEENEDVMVRMLGETH